VTAYALPPVSPFAGDDGSADPALAAALLAYAAGQADLHDVQRALVSARVLVPVVAQAGDEREAATYLSSVTIAGRDGRLAQPIFTSLDALSGWSPQARPVPSTAVDVARGAYAAGAVALLLDVAGPVDVVLEGPAMLALAECRPWLPPAQDPEVLAALGDALAGLPGLAGIAVGASADADFTLTLHVIGGSGTEPGSARDVAQQAAARLAGVDLLRVRLERGLDLAVTAS
jgi:SseB protein N-terminal domain